MYVTALKAGQRVTLEHAASGDRCEILIVSVGGADGRETIRLGLDDSDQFFRVSKAPRPAGDTRAARRV